MRIVEEALLAERSAIFCASFVPAAEFPENTSIRTLSTALKSTRERELQSRVRSKMPDPVGAVF